MTIRLSSRTSTRARALPAAVAVAIALLVSASSCALVNPDAVTVNGWSLSRKDFLAALSRIKNSADASSFFQFAPSRVTGGAGASLAVDRPLNEVDTVDASSVLTGLIQLRLLSEEVTRRKITVTDADRTVALAPPAADPSTGSAATSPAAALADMGALEGPITDGLVAFEALKRTFAEADTTPAPDVSAEARDLFDKGKDQVALVCFSAIVFAFPTSGPTDPTTGLAATVPVPGSPEDLATKQRATDAQAQVVFGADFAELARTQNDDPALKEKSGEAGCDRPANQKLPEEALTLDVGKASDPIPLPGVGYAIIQVTSREPAVFEEFKEQIEESLRSRALQARQQAEAGRVSEALRGVSRTATVHVDAMFGAWNSEVGAVDPPGGATPAPTIPPTTTPFPTDSFPLGEAPIDEAPDTTSPPATTPGSTPGTGPVGTAPSGTAAPRQ